MELIFVVTQMMQCCIAVELLSQMHFISSLPAIFCSLISLSSRFVLNADKTKLVLLSNAKKTPTDAVDIVTTQGKTSYVA